MIKFKKPNILIVDAVDINSRLLKRILKPLNVNIIQAISGEEVLLKIQGQDIALALIDISMPGMDGIELVNIIRKDKSSEIVPIIFITAQSEDEIDIKECYPPANGGGAGIVDFVFKPFNNFILLSKVKIFLELYRQKNQIQEQHLKLEQVVYEHKQAEETRRKTEEKFSDVIENIFKFVPQGLIVLTDKLNIFKKNKAVEDLVRHYAVKLNYSEEELMDILLEQVKTRLITGKKSEIRISGKKINEK